MEFKSKNCLRFFVFLSAIFLVERLEACPCGCGAVNPLVLNPGEDIKYAISMGQESSYKAVTNAGRIGSDGGPSLKSILNLSVAKAISQDVSVSASLGYEENIHHNEDNHFAFNDPSIGGRWTFHRQTFVRPWLPQAAATISFKRSVAKSIYDEQDRDYLMEVHSNGFHEATTGLDLWYGLAAWRLGLNQLYYYAFESSVNTPAGDLTLQPGLGSKTSLVSGYNWTSLGTALIVVDIDTKQPLRQNGVEVSDSQALTHSAALSLSFKVGTQKTIGVLAKKTAAFGQNKNTTQGKSITMSFMHVL